MPPAPPSPPDPNRIVIAALSYAELTRTASSRDLFAGGAHHLFRRLGHAGLFPQLRVAEHHALCRLVQRRLRARDYVPLSRRGFLVRFRARPGPGPPPPLTRAAVPPRGAGRHAVPRRGRLRVPAAVKCRAAHRQAAMPAAFKHGYIQCKLRAPGSTLLRAVRRMQLRVRREGDDGVHGFWPFELMFVCPGDSIAV